jgi:hypothetical protein
MSGGHGMHYPSREEFAKLLPKVETSKTLKTALLVMMVIGFGTFIAGAAMGNDRAWHALHFNWLYFATVATAAIAFVAVQRLVTARWSRGIIRLHEGHVAVIPFYFLILLVILFVGKPHIFTWAGREAITVAEKAAYLDPTFFALRGVVLFGAITVFALWYVWTSVRLDVNILPEGGSQWAAGLRARMRANWLGDERRELHNTHSKQGKLAVAVCMSFVVGWCFMAWDYSMTLSLHFQQTMYAWIVFMTGFNNQFMWLALAAFYWKSKMGDAHIITDQHHHDVGKLCFALTAFVGYISFSQFLVIWYGNMPEETHFYNLRNTLPWKPFGLAVLILVFIIPFFGLLSKSGKLFRPTMTLFAVSSILGVWLHRFMEVYPSIYGDTVTSVPFGLWEIAVAIGFIGLWGTTYFAFMDAFPKARVFMMTSKYRDEVQVPVDPRTMEPLPAHE